MIVVTGSTGHLGEALVRVLRAQDRPVRGIDIVASPFTDVVGSITDPALVEQCLDGATAVIHTATLHKPHVATHSRQAFIDTNITGTLVLLEAAVRSSVRAFLYTSTTSTFGDALVPAEGAPASWITEDIAPIPKNIYGVTKIAGEDQCALAARNQRLPCLVLRTSRFFPEDDDEPAAREAYAGDNLKTNEFLHRRVDIEDVVDAHLVALDAAQRISFGRYIISATTPFRRDDIAMLRVDAPAVVRARVPGWEEVYAARGWRMAPSIDRVYDNTRARTELGWQPKHDFAAVVARLRETGDVRSSLAKAIGEKGYHGK
jgi:nucleoside-diphosphate-sugar epimerase